MQRWIAAGLVTMVLFLGGGYYGYKTYKENRPAPMWVPLPIKPDLESAKRDEIIKDLKAKLSDPEILIKVSQDLGLRQQWNLPTDEACAQAISQKLFVRSGDAITEMGPVPAIHIGVNGTSKEGQLSGKIAMRLMDDVWKILGVPPPKKRDS
jgi:hypothetical protein